MTLDLDAIRQRADAATKGPWHVEYFGDSGYPQRIANDAAVVIADTAEGGGYPARNAEFMAAAREDVPALLAALAAVEADRDRLRPLAEAAMALHKAISEADSIGVQVHDATVWCAMEDLCAAVHDAAEPDPQAVTQ